MTGFDEIFKRLHLDIRRIAARLHLMSLGGQWH